MEPGGTPGAGWPTTLGRPRPRPWSSPDRAVGGALPATGDHRMAPRHEANGRPVRTPAREPDRQPVPTPEEVKALADRLDWAGQTNLLYLFLSDKQSIIGKKVLALLGTFQANVE